MLLTGRMDNKMLVRHFCEMNATESFSSSCPNLNESTVKKCVPSKSKPALPLNKQLKRAQFRFFRSKTEDNDALDAKLKRLFFR